MTVRQPKRLLLAPAALLAVGLAWAGCSVEKHYALLSALFDGVPAPGAAGAGDGALAGDAALPVLSAHTAYADRRCGECHGDSSQFSFVVSGFSEMDSTVCLKCHADRLDEFPLIHGPVAAGACLWCHQPHESPYPHLLKSSAPALCLNCHDPELATTAAVPEHVDRERSCLDCHHGHGGQDRSFLRPYPPPEEPLTEEADSTAVEPHAAREP